MTWRSNERVSLAIWLWPALIDKTNKCWNPEGTSFLSRKLEKANNHYPLHSISEKMQESIERLEKSKSNSSNWFSARKVGSVRRVTYIFLAEKSRHTRPIDKAWSSLRWHSGARDEKNSFQCQMLQFSLVQKPPQKDLRKKPNSIEGKEA